MSDNWSLKELYTSFTSKEFLEDLDKVDKNINDLKVFSENLNKDSDSLKSLEDIINKLENIYLLISKVASFASLTVSADSKNVEGRKYLDVINNKNSLLAEPLTKIYKWIASVENIDEIINKSTLLKNHEFIIREIISKNKYMLSDKEEAIIAKMRTTGSDAWSNYKDYLISTHKVDINVDGKEESLPLTVVLNMAYSKDPEVRKKAYEAEIKSYEKIEEGVAAALNGIKGEVITTSELKGYKSPLHMTLEESRMDEDILNAMLTAIKESLPTFRKYLKRKAEILGHKNGLPFYDLYAPVIEKEMKFTFEEGKAFVEKNFRKFSDNLADFVLKAFENNWLDVYPKEGKVGGAFCASIKDIKESRILLNYGNSFSDVVTMAHELGHGFHGECLNNETMLNSEYPMTLAETASNFCEILIKKSAVKEASKEEAFAILEAEISDCNQVIVDIYSRFLFESEVFEKRKESSLSVEEINNAMLNAQKEAYGDGLDSNYLHKYMWTWKPHYYYATANFYNFPYAFGNLFAKGLYAEYLKRGDSFCKEYEELLAVTGKNMVADVTKIMNIDVHDVNFWRNSLKLIEEDIEKFIELSYEIK
ncbi:MULTISPECIES: M3 family oligoendopeptidase [unclassified Clostridium]|uniref:M3 family oligoendopeptidase n=1 Tax=unclassified Clostridium TaxID=2614128 RepID=UPI0025E02712|nr:M3 family oligoendopeptidase [Clostridium sp.]MCI6691816.1 M3 family oligoendopeptidase [Clostridium sp.]MDY2631738.1 M3 family oligoendopeptidase [Clostridium sp.]MDY4251213.1 M3 family oligoendopeptidase [Clostridium sp.]